MEKIRSLVGGSISKKVAVSCALAVIVIFISLTVIIYYLVKGSFYKSGISELDTQVKLIKQMIETFDASSRNSASQFFSIFSEMFKGEFSVDTSKKVTVVNIEAPILKNGSEVLNLNNHYVDAFSKMTGGSVATIFVRDGDDFIRVATSLKKEDGSRAMGTKLDRAHPAYQPMLRGEEYLGPAKLFGKDYMTKYRPIKDKQNKVIGILFIGFDITSSINGMLNEIAKIKVGDTGYVFILDSKGTAVLHPAQKGKSMIDAKDADDKPIIKEFVEKKEGIMTYRWINKELGEMFPREKIAVYAHAKGFNWIIASGSYTDELFREIIKMRNLLVVGVLISSLLVSIMIFVITSRLLKPIKQVTENLESIIKGDLTVRIKYSSNDEIGQLANMMNRLSESFNDMISGLVQG
ncbi:MAG: Cache 3/Cache 2 fusion domain-containing protein, partial [Thermodesulfovibrionales bacterium]